MGWRFPYRNYKTKHESKSRIQVGGVNHCLTVIRTVVYWRNSVFCDVYGELHDCDWSERSHNLELKTGLLRKGEFPSQSQPCISPCTSKHEYVSLVNDGVNASDCSLPYSGEVRAASQVPNLTVRTEHLASVPLIPDPYSLNPKPYIQNLHSKPWTLHP